MNKKPIVVGIGEILWDLLPEGRRLGGAPANFAYHAAAQGADACVVSAVGKDEDGQAVFSELKKKGLDRRYIAVVPGHPTGAVSVELSGGIPSYRIHEQAAWDYIPFTDGLRALARKSDAVCFGTLAQRGAVSAEAIGQFIENTRTDCLKVFDVNLRGDYFSAELIDASLHHCSILKISDEELPVVADLLGVSGSNEDIAAEILKCYPLQYVVLTLGKKGSAAYDGKTVCKVPIYDSGPVVDTVGCGDSFTASLTVCLLQGVQIEDAMEQAAKVAGDVASCPGAMPEIPDLI